jgi:phospholipase/carboxylesterase
VTTLTIAERPAEGEAQGLLVLHHGRGTDERDLLPLADELDPQRRLHVVAPRGPLEVPGWPGNHWYIVPRVGYPDPQTFASSYAALAQLHDELWERTRIPPERTVLGGFSMGCVMSYALGLGPDRRAPAGILALSGFIPTVAGWRSDAVSRSSTSVLIAHGRRDPVISVEFARRARALLEEDALPVQYHEFDGGHHLDPTYTTATRAWLTGVVEDFAGSA